MQRIEPRVRPSLNLILLGTGEHHAEVETVLTLLAKAIEENANQKVHVIDGPGANAPLDSDHPMLGTYHFSCLTDSQTATIIPVKLLKTGFMETTSTIGGLIAGSGCQDAIREAVQYIDAVIATGKKPLVLNMFGYSRGSDTAVRLSNVLYGLYPREEIEINIFAIDPVPGPKRHSSIRSRLVDVNDYEMVLMCHETRPFLIPQDLAQLEVKNPDILRVHMLNGDHGASKRFRYHPQYRELGTEANKRTTDTPRLLWHAIHAFIKRHGIVLKDNQQIPFVAFDDGRFSWSASGQFRVIQQNETNVSEEKRAEIRLKLYTQMQKNENYYREFSSPFGVEREFVARKADYFLHGVSFFQDKEHMQLFQKQYPHFFDYYFQKNKEGKSPAAVVEDIHAMRANDPDLLILLEQKGYGKVVNFTAETLPAPRGIPVVMRAMYANKDLMQLFWNLQTACLGVIGGNDKSISKENAEAILLRARKIMIADYSDAKKIICLQTLISEAIFYHQHDGIFASKLIALVPSHKMIEIKARKLLSDGMADPDIKQVEILVLAISDAAKILEKISASVAAPAAKAQEIKATIQSLQLCLGRLPASNASKKLAERVQDFLNFRVPTLQVVDHIVADLDRYLNRFEWFGLFRNIELVEQKKRIASLVKTTLLALKQHDAGDNLDAIKKVIELSSLVSGRVHTCHACDEGRLDKIFRNASLNLPKLSTEASALSPNVIALLEILRSKLHTQQLLEQTGLFARQNTLRAIQPDLLQKVNFSRSQN